MDGLYTARITRKAPPRAGATYGSGAVRVVACNNATSVIQLNNDIFQFPAPANTVASPGSFGRARIYLQGDTANNIYFLLGSTNGVTANSAATSGNTQCALLGANKIDDFELDPQVDLYLSARTKNGSSDTATLRYWIVSFPTTDTPAAG